MKDEAGMFFARLASAIKTEENQMASRVANALAGSTEKERDEQNQDWNRRVDALEKKFRTVIQKMEKDCPKGD